MEVIQVQISDIVDDTRPNSILVEIASTKKQVWLPRRWPGGKIEFWPGRVVIPLWLAKKVLGDLSEAETDKVE